MNAHIIFDLDVILIDLAPEIQDTFGRTFSAVPGASAIAFDAINFEFGAGKRLTDYKNYGLPENDNRFSW